MIPAWVSIRRSCLSNTHKRPSTTTGYELPSESCAICRVRFQWVRKNGCKCNIHVASVHDADTRFGEICIPARGACYADGALSKSMCPSRLASRAAVVRRHLRQVGSAPVLTELPRDANICTREALVRVAVCAAVVEIWPLGSSNPVPHSRQRPRCMHTSAYAKGWRKLSFWGCS